MEIDRTLDPDTVRGWDRIAGTAGAFVVALFLIRLLTPQDLADITSDNRRGHEVSVFFTFAGVGFFLIFLAGAWSRMRRSEGVGGMYSGLFVVGGAIFAAIVLLSASFDLAVLKADDAEAALLPLAQWADLSAGPAAVAMCLGAATAIVAGQGFPTWLGLSAVLVGFAYLLGTFGVFGGNDDESAGPGSAGLVAFLLFIAWVAAASVVLLLRPGDGANDPA